MTGPENPAAPTHILIVEDNPATARSVREMLDAARTPERAGPPFDVTWTTCLADALQRLSTGGVDLVLLDLSLPDSTGLDTLGRIDVQAPHVPVIVLTGTADEALAIAAVQQGAQDYVVKGQTDTGLLVRAINYAVERNRSEDEFRCYADTLATLHETALDLVNQRALPDFLQAVVARAADLLGAKGGCIYLYRASSDDLHIALTYNLAPDLTGVVVRRGEGLSGSVLQSGEAMATADCSQWKGGAGQLQDLLPHLGAISAVPIRWGNRLLGVLNVLDDTGRLFSPQDMLLLERFAPLAAVALENARLLTDLQEQMKHLKSTQAQLIQSARLAAIGELASGVAHELNNPLTSVLGFSELLLEELDPGSPWHQDMATIVQGARRARDIVRNMLDFARQAKPHRQPTDINVILRQTIALVGPFLNKQGIRIEESYDEEIGLFFANEGQLKQVVLNLISNAVQAMPDGGTLALRTAQVEDGLTISVSDTGVGMPPEVRDHIFEPFFTTRTTGTGLGLSVSQGIIKEHGGCIAVESWVGQGSLFTIWLPEEGRFEEIEAVGGHRPTRPGHPLQIDHTTDEKRPGER